MTSSTVPPLPATSRLALLAAGITVVLWASAFVGIRGVGNAYGPGALALGRLLVGTITLGAVVAVRRPAWPAGRDLMPILAYGVSWFAAYNIALNAAERHLDAGTASMLVNLGPVLIAVSAGIILKEGFGRPLMLGSAAALAGAVVIAAGASSAHAVDAVGVGLGVLAAVLYAIGVTLQKPVLARVSALTATWLGCAVGTIVCLPFAPQLWSETTRASGRSIAGLAYLGVVPTAIAFTTWAYALARTSAGNQGATTYLVPVVAILISWAVLGELPPGLSYVGGGLCLVGVAISRLRHRSAHPPDRAATARQS
ncbi:MAG: DMT family transporter [Mycobacteriales bacterium]